MTGPLALALLVLLLGACGRQATPTEPPVPVYLRLVPCGGATPVQRAGSGEGVTVDAPVVVDGEVRLTTGEEESGRLCLGDNSIVELAPASAIDVRPGRDGMVLEIELQEGRVMLLAYAASYQVTTSVCPVTMTDLPARIEVEDRGGARHVMVEQGSATCDTGSEPISLPTCWELVIAPGEEPEIAQYCGPEAETPAVETPSATPSPLPSPTAETSEPSPSGTPPTAEPATSTPEPAATATPRPATPTPEPTPIP